MLAAAIALTEAAVFLAMIINLYRAKKTLDSDKFSLLKEGEQND